MARHRTAATGQLPTNVQQELPSRAFLDEPQHSIIGHPQVEAQSN